MLAPSLRGCDTARGRALSSTRVNIVLRWLTCNSVGALGLSNEENVRRKRGNTANRGPAWLLQARLTRCVRLPVNLAPALPGASRRFGARDLTTFEYHDG